MQEKRLELSWYCYHTDLNRARLPIPPFLRTIAIIALFLAYVNRFCEKLYTLKGLGYKRNGGYPSRLFHFPNKVFLYRPRAAAAPSIFLSAAF